MLEQNKRHHYSGAAISVSSRPGHGMTRGRRPVEPGGEQGGRGR